MNSVDEFLAQAEGNAYLYSYSALDRYWGREHKRIVRVLFAGDIAGLARIYDDVQFPGIPEADALLKDGHYTYLVVCSDALQESSETPLSAGCTGEFASTFPALSLLFDPLRGRFYDACGSYPYLRNRIAAQWTSDGTISGNIQVAGGPAEAESLWNQAAALAVLVSSYPYESPDSPEYDSDSSFPGDKHSTLEQQEVLTRVLCGENAHKGLEILMNSGYIQAHWPELMPMNMINHTKEHHPEGNVWEHTVETMRYRKRPDLALSLGLLLHDSGKPHAREQDGRKFDRHAQIGKDLALRLLSRLGFDRELIDETAFLVDQHMLPGFISRLSVYRTEQVMASVYFPKLLELYRCDLSSTWRGPSGYYEACKTYRSFLKNRKNPFRRGDGKKMLNLYVE